MNNILLVFLGGGIGSLLRFGIAELVKANVKSAFPLATLCSNICSCLILAVTIGFFSAKLVENPSLRLFIIVGICGGFSTFSAFSYDTVLLMRSGNLGIAIINILLSVAVCTAIIYYFTKTTTL